MNSKIFLENLFAHFDENRIGYAIVRSYESLPDKISASDIASDIDIAIKKADIKQIVEYLFSIDKVYVTSFAKRIGTLNLFINIDGKESLQIDLIHSFNYQGIKYLSAKKIIEKRKKYKSFYIAGDKHQFVLMLLPHYFYKSEVKAKYKTKLKDIIAGKRLNVVEELSSLFSSKKVLDIIQLKDNLNLKSDFFSRHIWQYLFYRPLYFLYELKNFIFRPFHTRVAFLGVDGAGKSTLISNFNKRASGIAKTVKIQHLKPILFLKKRAEKRGVVTDPHGQKRRGWVSSNLKLPMFFLEYWIDFFKNTSRTSELQIYDRYFDDMLVDNKRYRFNGSKFLARIFVSLVPRPKFFVFVYCDPEVINKRKAELPLQTSKELTEKYKNYLKNKDHIQVSTEVKVKEAEHNLTESFVKKLHQINKKRLLNG